MTFNSLALAARSRHRLGSSLQLPGEVGLAHLTSQPICWNPSPAAAAAPHGYMVAVCRHRLWVDTPSPTIAAVAGPVGTCAGRKWGRWWAGGRLDGDGRAEGAAASFSSWLFFLTRRASTLPRRMATTSAAWTGESWCVQIFGPRKTNLFLIFLL